MSGPERQPVLLEEADVIAAKLLANREQWFVIAAGGRERMRVLLTTAWKIRKGKLAAFHWVTNLHGGKFEARTLTSPTRANKVGDVEIKARWVPGD